MEVQYRQSFVKDLKKLKKQPIYQQILEIAFRELPATQSLLDIPDVKAMKGYSGRYRIRVSDYRIGLELKESSIELVRVMHRREFYRYFP